MRRVAGELKVLARWLAAVLAAALILSANSAAAQAADDRAIRVVSFNIRYDTNKDGENAWRFRRERVIEHLVKLDADFIGLQEVLPSQRADLDAALSDYASVGRTRETSPAEGEATPIFYKRSSWMMISSRSGTFWLSETPGSPGTLSWKTSCPRIATWGVFQERETGRRVMVVNTHFDHESQEARQEGARVIAEFLAGEAIDLPVIVTGDFNAGPANPARRILCEGVAGSPPLVDTYSDRYSGSERNAGTYHGFRGGMEGSRIDAILVSAAFDITSASIDRTVVDNIRLSDHYPVVAELRLKVVPPAGAPPAQPPTAPNGAPPAQAPRAPEGTAPAQPAGPDGVAPPPPSAAPTPPPPPPPEDPEPGAR